MKTAPTGKDAGFINVLGAFVTTIHDEITLQFEDEAGAGGAAPAALAAIDTWPECSIESLSGVLGLTHSGTVRLVARLGSAGLVARDKGADARSVELRLTGLGWSVLRRMRQARQRILERVVGDLSESEEQVLATVLDRALRATRRSAVQAKRCCRLCDHSVCQGDACPVGSSVNAG